VGTWKNRGLRGSVLEELLNATNEIYRSSRIALIQKIPTPITPMEIDKETRHITLAYFDRRSTVDYIGAVQGIPVCFDAKECAADTFPLANVHEHQVEFMKDFREQGGVSFLIISFTERDEIYLMPLEELLVYWERMARGGRKSFTYEEMRKGYRIPKTRDVPVHYLEALSWYVEDREEREERAAGDAAGKSGG